MVGLRGFLEVWGLGSTAFRELLYSPPLAPLMNCTLIRLNINSKVLREFGLKALNFVVLFLVALSSTPLPHIHLTFFKDR